MGGASKQLSYTLLPLHSQFALPLSKEETVAALHVRLLSTVRGQISDIRYFSVQACGKYFGFSLCPAEPIFYSPDVLSRIGGVAIGLPGRDHFNTRSRYKFRSRPQLHRVVA